MVADALGVELGRHRVRSRVRTDDLRPGTSGSWTIAAGCVAGIATSWQGRLGDRTVIDLRARWSKGETLDPLEVRVGYFVEMEGRPCEDHARDRTAEGVRVGNPEGVRRSRDDHDLDAGDQRHPIPWSPLPPASLPTRTSCCPCHGESSLAEAEEVPCIGPPDIHLRVDHIESMLAIAQLPSRYAQALDARTSRPWSISSAPGCQDGGRYRSRSEKACGPSTTPCCRTSTGACV